MTKNQFKLLKLPENPGVYFFRQNKTPIYIGKAKNLKNRLGSYFLTNLSPKTQTMVSEADNLSFIKVESELESLLLEAKLIRENQPRYNSVSKDDKHPLYIKITSDYYPIVTTARKADILPKDQIFGPFPSSRNVYMVVRMLRKIFPFSDHKLGSRGCIYSHLGLCNPCPSEIARIPDPKLKTSQRQIYLKNIRRIRATLSGKFNKVRAELTKEMENFSKKQMFEEAGLLKDKISRLDYITQPIIPGEFYLENPNLTSDIRSKELTQFKKLISSGDLNRIECFDISHLAGVAPTASMVTFVNGEADKTLYRHFKIHQIKGSDDIASMREVARRRIKYLKTWGEPDLIIVDGGKTQVSAFKEIFAKTDIPIVGIAKRFETLVIPVQNGFKQVRLKKGDALRLVQRIRDEAHRFARKYHHNLLKRELLYN